VPFSTKVFVQSGSVFVLFVFDYSHHTKTLADKMVNGQMTNIEMDVEGKVTQRCAGFDL